MTPKTTPATVAELREAVAYAEAKVADARHAYERELRYAARMQAALELAERRGEEP